MHPSTGKLLMASLLGTAALLVPLVTLTAQQNDNASLTGRLTDHETGAPLAAEVGLAIRTEKAVILKHATANEQGEFEFTDLPSGALHLSTKHDGYAVERTGFRLAARETRRLELQLVKAAVVHGWVMDSRGTPLVAAQVKASYARADLEFENSFQWETGDARSDEQGRFELEVHPEREFILEAAHADFLSDFSLPMRFAAVAGRMLSLQLTKGVSLVGEARDQFGNPLAGAQVQLRDARVRPEQQRFLLFEALQQSQQFTVTGADGSFRFTKVRPVRKLLLVTHPKYSPGQQTLELDEQQPSFATKVFLQRK